jgi:hypothetical protein
MHEFSASRLFEKPWPDAEPSLPLSVRQLCCAWEANKGTYRMTIRFAIPHPQSHRSDPTRLMGYIWAIRADSLFSILQDRGWSFIHFSWYIILSTPDFSVFEASIV